MRVQSSTGVRLEDAEKSESVPSAARYRAPTKDELESSRTLSARKIEEITKRVNSLPSTPE